MNIPRGTRPLNDSGSVTPFVLIIVTALFALSGLVLDGGRALAAKIEANGHAEAAARAGAQVIDLSEFREHGTVGLHPNGAAVHARQHLSEVGADGVVTTSENTVIVEVTSTRPTLLLHIVGIPTVTAHGHGVARPHFGVTAENR